LNVPALAIPFLCAPGNYFNEMTNYATKNVLSKTCRRLVRVGNAEVIGLAVEAIRIGGICGVEGRAIKPVGGMAAVSEWLRRIAA
jgi:hypothetical protein